MSYELAINLLDHGRPEFIRALTDFPKEADVILKAAVNKATATIEFETKSKAPARTGTLRRSIHADQAQVTDSAVRGKVSTELKYAPYVEYGVQAHGPTHARALRFVINGKVVYAKRVKGFAGRFFFREGLAQSRLKIDQVFDEAVGRLVTLLAGQ